MRAGVFTIALASIGLCCGEEKPLNLEAWPETKQARIQKMTKVELAALPAPDPDVDLPHQDVRQEAQKSLNQALRKLGMPIATQLEWNASGSVISANQHAADGSRVYASMESGDETFVYVSVMRSKSFHPDVFKDTPDAFLNYAADCYRKVFGVEPVGKASIKGPDKSEEGGVYGTVVWSCEVEGLHLGNNRFEIQYRNDGSYDMTLTRWLMHAEVRDCREYMKKYPVELGEREAVALVYKTWKSMGQLPAARAADEVRYQTRLIKSNPDELYAHFHSGDRMLWRNDRMMERDRPPYVRSVSLHWGLFEVVAEMDWRTGEMLWMRQGTMQW